MNRFRGTSSRCIRLSMHLLPLPDGAVKKNRLLFSSRCIRLSMHHLPLPDGRGSVSSIKHLRSRDRKGAVNGAGDASAFECAKNNSIFFHRPVRERQTVPGIRKQFDFFTTRDRKGAAKGVREVAR